MPFTLTEDHLESLFDSAQFPVPANEMVFGAFRGCVPLENGGTPFRSSHALEYIGVDYRHLHCTLFQWRAGKGFAVFPGSTVPYIEAVEAGARRQGAGVNELALGFYHGRHSYYRGDHGVSRPNSRHRAFRNDSTLPVWRTIDDHDFQGDDILDTASKPNDNIHCAWQQNAAAPYYSSNGCQVIVGRPRVPPRGWEVELGPWALFVANAYDTSQTRFAYALFSGLEALRLADAGTSGERFPTVRFGSKGELVEIVQDALQKHGYDVGATGADGDCGLGTVGAVRMFQAANFGSSGVDLIVGPSTGKALGLNWPKLGCGLPSLITAPANPQGPAEQTAHQASAANAAEDATGPGYRALTPDGFFSSTPFDTSIKRSIRTNNPGALNISEWQKVFRGFAGVTQPDSAGNKTAIYFTPEHGVAAWYYLITARYSYGTSGQLSVRQLAGSYAGTANLDHPAVKDYIAGWRKWSGSKLGAGTSIDLGDIEALLRLARAMFSHEAGQKTPLKDDQITSAIDMQRKGTLPPV